MTGLNRLIQIVDQKGFPTLALIEQSARDQKRITELEAKLTALTARLEALES